MSNENSQEENNVEKYSRPKSRRYRKDLTVCIDCEQKLTEENWRNSLRENRRYTCNSCWAKRQHRYAKNNPERALQRKKQARLNRKEAKKSWTPEQKEKERRRQYNNTLKKTYGITIEDHDQMLETQNYSCAICKTKEPEGQGTFHVDHCHSTGNIRKLLCAKCNMMLGLAGDNIVTLETAIKYLIEHKGEKL